MVRLDRITMHGFKSFANKVTIPFPDGFNCVAGPNGSGKSTRWDTEVILDTGEIKPIGEIVENALRKSALHVSLDDGVYTLENPEHIRTWGLDPQSMKVVKKDIAAFIKREGEPYLYKFTTKTGKSAVTTGCHPVMVYRNGEIKSEVIENLKDGDLIATPRKLDFPEIDVKLPIPGMGKIDGARVQISGKRRNSKTISLPLHVDEPFSRFLGYMVGDGCILPKANRCDFTNADEELLEDFIHLSEEIGLVPSVYEHKKNVKVIALNSGTLANALCAIFKNRIKKEQKHMPSAVLFSRKSVLAQFLAGLFDCDASVRKDNPTFEYTTMSEQLASHVQLALLRFGIVARKTMKLKYAANTNSRTRKPYFYVTIEGKEKLSMLYASIPLRCLHKRERLKSIIDRTHRPGSNIDVLPQDVNRLVRAGAQVLGIQVKPLRKQFPWLAAYNENRCCPTRSGIAKTALLFRDKYHEIEQCRRDLRAEKSSLLRALDLLNIRRRHASGAIGLQRDSINNSWVFGNFSGKRKNLEALRNHLDATMTFMLAESGKVIGVLEKLADSDIFWDRIERIEQVKGEDWVYDLTIPNCHNFIGNGIFVHNSNIVDALTFVLGTTSARSIRAQKLQNLIFNGAADRKPAEFCEVTLYLNNADRKIPGEDEEVKVTRRITRSGISIYKLNGRSVTRAKILDLFANANLSPDGYNIIMQGDVTRIIEMNPKERRGIIDEISGIAEFDEKKEKAQRELEKVELRVRESMIVVAEKQRLVQRLKQEKENAERYQKLSDTLRVSRASLIRKRLAEAERKMAEIEGQAKDDLARFEEVEKQFLAAEKESEGLEKRVSATGNEIIAKSRNYDVVRNIDRLQTEILRKRDRIDVHDREIARLESTSRERIPAVEAVLRLGWPGVFGTLSSLLRVPKKYSTAIEVALGRHAHDIVVDSDETATRCIKFLKEKKIGRTRFLPLDRLSFPERRTCPHKIIGFAIDLVSFDKAYAKAMEYTLGSTIVVEDIDTARKIRDFRIATLDGDLIERSGAMIGGFYRQRRQFGEDISKLREAVAVIEGEIASHEAELEKLKGMEEQESEEVRKLQDEKTKGEAELEAKRKSRKGLFEERLILQNKVGKLRVEKAKVEAGLDSMRIEANEYKDVEQVIDAPVDALQEEIRKCLIELNRLGPVNMRSLEEYGIISVEFDEIKKKLDKLIEEKESILRIVQEVEKKRHGKFMEVMERIMANFSKIYHDLTGGAGILRLEEENNIDSGLVIEASPEGKKVLNLDAMSGGEKTLTSLSFLFAILQHYASPFYVLDEIDAALDKANTKKIIDLVKNYSKETQFIVISHNDFTIQEADKVFGVSMEGGVSKVFGIELPRA